MSSSVCLSDCQTFKNWLILKYCSLFALKNFLFAFRLKLRQANQQFFLLLLFLYCYCCFCFVCLFVFFIGKEAVLYFVVDVLSLLMFKLFYVWLFSFLKRRIKMSSNVMSSLVSFNSGSAAFLTTAATLSTVISLRLYSGLDSGRIYGQRNIGCS